MRELKGLEERHPELVTGFTHSEGGAAPVEAFGIVKHRLPLLSLGNVFTSEGIDSMV